jgi:hypothetical protein
VTSPSTSGHTIAVPSSAGSVTLASDPLLAAMHDALSELAATARPAVRAAEVSSPCGGSTCGGTLGRVVAFVLVGIALASSAIVLLLGRGSKRSAGVIRHR